MCGCKSLNTGKALLALLCFFAVGEIAQRTIEA